MNKELEALQDLSKLVFVYGGVEQYRIIEAALKALEIIREKRVDVDMFLKCKDLDSYNYNILYWHGKSLTQEEFDCLREVLL